MERATDEVLHITRMGQAGDGVASGTDGRVVFVPGALPGETVKARLTGSHAHYARMELIEVMDPSPHRVTPQCPLYGECGGCSLEHWDYAAELQYKEERVRQALVRIAHQDGGRVNPIVGSPSRYGYRNKGQFPYGRLGSEVVLGLYRRGSHRLVPIQACAIQDPVINEVLQVAQTEVRSSELPAYDEGTGRGVLRHLVVRSSHTTGEALVLLVVKEDHPGLKPYAQAIYDHSRHVQGVAINVNGERTNRILGSHTKVAVGRPYIDDTILNLTFRMSFTSFFQVHAEQAATLYRLALQDLPEDCQEVWDLYSGVGTLACLAATRARRVRALESNPEAVKDAEVNRQLNHLNNVTMQRGQVEEEISHWVKNGARPPDAVIVDPPRRGLDPQVVHALLELGPQRIIYVSCNPETWARDISRLAGSYQLVQATPVDMFPQTDHVECCSYLERQT